MHTNNNVNHTYSVNKNTPSNSHKHTRIQTQTLQHADTLSSIIYNGLSFRDAEYILCIYIENDNVINLMDCRLCAWTDYVHMDRMRDGFIACGLKARVRFLRDVETGTRFVGRMPRKNKYANTCAHCISKLESVESFCRYLWVNRTQNTLSDRQLANRHRIYIYIWTHSDVASSLHPSSRTKRTHNCVTHDSRAKPLKHSRVVRSLS